MLTATGVFLAQGVEPGASGTRRIACAFDGLTGAELWSTRVELGADGWLGHIDPRGTSVGIFHPNAAGNRYTYTSFDLGSGRAVGTLIPERNVVGAHGTLFVRGRVLHRMDETMPRFTLGSEVDLAFGTVGAAGDRMLEQYEGIQRGLGTYEIDISPDGRLVVHGTQDGRVMVCDVLEVERQLRLAGQH